MGTVRVSMFSSCDIAVGRIDMRFDVAYLFFPGVSLPRQHLTKTSQTCAQIHIHVQKNRHTHTHTHVTPLKSVAVLVGLKGGACPAGLERLKSCVRQIDGSVADIRFKC